MGQVKRPGFGLVSVVKGAQVWDFRPIFFYTNKSYMGRWLEDWINFYFFFEDYGRYSQFCVFCACWVCAKKRQKMPTQAEPALKNVYAGWACAKKLPTPAEPAQKNVYAGWACANIFLGMANLCYFDQIDVSTLQRPVLLLGLSTLQRRVLHLDVSTLQRHVLHIDVSTLQRPVLNLDVSTLQRSLLHLNVSTSWCPVQLLMVSTHRDLYFSWRCLHYRGLNCISTCLH